MLCKPVFDAQKDVFKIGSIIEIENHCLKLG